jgi:spoIIIJ-associated protein
VEWVETTGRSIQEAKDAALDQLGVDEDDAEFVVVNEPRPGLFGRMRGEARVRARVRPASPRPKRGRARLTTQAQATRGRRSENRQEGSSARSGRGAVSVVDRGEEPGSGEDAAEARAGGAAGAARSGTAKRRRSRSRGGRRSTSTQNRESGEGTRPVKERSTAKPRASQETDEPRDGDTEEEEGVGEELTLEEQGESAREFVEGLVDALGLTATVGMARVDSDTVQVSVDGAELGLLIGPGGATLSALQELARTYVQRRTGGRTERILVDVAGYRAKRAEALQRFTARIAEEVLSSGSERAMEPMSAADRKVVHDTINEMDGVQTRSVGEEPRRYIVIAPSSIPEPSQEADG